MRLSLESLISELLESHAKETRGAVLEVSGLLIHRNASRLRWYKPGSWISESMDPLQSGEETLAAALTATLRLVWTEVAASALRAPLPVGGFSAVLFLRVELTIQLLRSAWICRPRNFADGFVDPRLRSSCSSAALRHDFLCFKLLEYHEK